MTSFAYASKCNGLCYLYAVSCLLSAANADYHAIFTCNCANDIENTYTRISVMQYLHSLLEKCICRMNNRVSIDVDDFYMRMNNECNCSWGNLMGFVRDNVRTYVLENGAKFCILIEIEYPGLALLILWMKLFLWIDDNIG